MSDHIDDTKTNLRLLEEAQTCEALPMTPPQFRRRWLRKSRM